MSLPTFAMHRPCSLEEASELLEQLGEDAILYCGGTELLPLFKFGFAEYPNLIDVKGIEELSGLKAANGELHVGAAETHRMIERSLVVRERWPAFARMERRVGNLRVRNTGTIGGNLCFADPHSDPATFLLAAGAELSCRRGGEPLRRMSIGDFIKGPFDTALQSGELLVSVHIPELLPGSAVVHRKLSFHEYPAVTVACFAYVENGRLADLRLAVGSVGVVPVRARAAEDMLLGTNADALETDTLKAVGAAAAEMSNPVEDANGSKEYKSHLVGILTQRVVTETATEARNR